MQNCTKKLDRQRGILCTCTQQIRWKDLLSIQSLFVSNFTVRDEKSPPKLGKWRASHTAFIGLLIAKKKPLPIQCSWRLRDSQEPKATKNFFQFSRWLFQKIPFLYFFLHKSWIWRTMGHVMNIFSYWHIQHGSGSAKSRIYPGKSTKRGFSK